MRDSNVAILLVPKLSVKVWERQRAVVLKRIVADSRCTKVVDEYENRAMQKKQSFSSIDHQN